MTVMNLHLPHTVTHILICIDPVMIAIDLVKRGYTPYQACKAVMMRHGVCTKSQIERLREKIEFEMFKLSLKN